MFNDNQNVINQSTGRVIKYFTGLESVRILAINPTEEQLQEIIGDGAKNFDTVYAETEFNGRVTRPVVFWVQDVNELTSPCPVQINIGAGEETFSTGSVRVMNDYLQNTISPQGVDGVLNNPKMNWFSPTGIKIARVGEVAFNDLLTKALKMNVKEAKANEVLSEENCDFDSVLNGDFSGIRRLPKYLNTIGGNPVMLFTVKETEDETGKIKLRQRVLCRPENTYRPTDDVGEWHWNKVMNLHLTAANAGRELCQDYYTAKFQEFSKEECLNYEKVPTETMSEVDNNGDVDWLS